jgi:hypothetical protein
MHIVRTPSFRWFVLFLLALGLGLVLTARPAGPAFAQETIPTAPSNEPLAPSAATIPGPLDSLASTTPTTIVSNASQARVNYFAPTRAQIATRASRLSVRSRTRADGRLEQAAKAVDETVRAQPAAVVAQRLSARFGTPVDELIAEQKRLDVSWGHLVIAHVIDESAPETWTIDQIVALRKDRTGWGQIAAGLGLELGSFLRNSELEVRVATGQMTADARADLLRSNPLRAELGVAE